MKADAHERDSGFPHRLGIGTAQFGLEYGVTNDLGRPSLEEAAEIIELASREGIQVIDTAPAYGDSETILGHVLPRVHPFRIVTKTPNFRKSRLTFEDANVLIRTFHTSLKRLSQSSVYGLMIHYADDLLSEGADVLMGAVNRLKNQRLVEKIGVSVYTAQQIDAILSRYSIDLIQLPVNVLDQRLIRSGHLDTLKRHGVEIHARSTFLQGILLADIEKLPKHFESLQQLLKDYHDFRSRHNLNALQAALAFHLGISELDCAVLGVCHPQQLAEITEAARSLQGASIDFTPYACNDERYVNPVRWAA